MREDIKSGAIPSDKKRDSGGGNQGIGKNLQQNVSILTSYRKNYWQNKFGVLA